MRSTVIACASTVLLTAALVAPVAANALCEDKDRAGFKPRAQTVVKTHVRVGVPSFSFMKGTWVMAEARAVLGADTCVQVLEHQSVARGAQTWYRIAYIDSNGQVARGWVWAGKDQSHFRGDVGVTGSSPLEDVFRSLASFSLVSEARADMATPAFGPDGLPVEGEPLPVPTELFTLGLFIVMLAGMVAKVVWDATGEAPRRPDWVQLVRPVLVSPLAFLAVVGPIQAQQGQVVFSLMSVLLAFQGGFMWQDLVRAKLAGERAGAITS